MHDLYDVILTGIDSGVSERREIVKSIAELLEMDSGQLENLIDDNPLLTVKKGISLDDARNYQHHIRRRGGYCNYRPTRESLTELELEPKATGMVGMVFLPATQEGAGKPSDQAKLSLKPGYSEDMRINQGIIDRANLLSRNQPDSLQRNLLGKYTWAGHQAQRQVFPQHKAQRLKLEREVQRQLGLPKAINSRLRLYAAAALCWMIGVGMGVAGLALYVQNVDPGMRRPPVMPESENKSAADSPDQRKQQKKALPGYPPP